MIFSKKNFFILITRTRDNGYVTGNKSYYNCIKYLYTIPTLTFRDAIILSPYSCSVNYTNETIYIELVRFDILNVYVTHHCLGLCYVSPHMVSVRVGYQNDRKT